MTTKFDVAFMANGQESGFHVSNVFENKAIGINRHDCHASAPYS